MRTKSARLTVAALAVAAAAAAVPSPAAAAEPQASPEAIDAYLSELAETSGVPGLSAVVTHEDEVVFAGGYGHDSNGEDITEDTPMRVASVSKSFTAMAVMILVEEGAIDLDGTVAGQLPGFAMADDRAAEVTVRQLLNQTSGFSDTSIDVVDLEAAASLEEYVSRLGDDALAADPGTAYAYCNVNFDVAARLVEVASGQSFAAFMRERVFGPLGMEHSATRDEDVMPGLGYNSLFGLWIAREEAPGFIDDSGSGGIITSAADMGTWLISQGGHGEQLVSPEGLQEMHTPSAIQEYGMGWAVESDGTLVHSGNLMTYNAVEWIDPESGYGIALLTNGAGLADVTYAGMEGLAAVVNGEAPEEPARDRQLWEVVLGALCLVAIGLGVLGVRRSRRWAEKRAGRRRWVTGLRVAAWLIPAAVFAAYPSLVSLISAGRTVTWPSVWYFALPLSVTLLVAALSGAAVAVARVVRLRSVGSVA
ncbi:beta-lactamase family protein [Glycomyces sp. A-F 0318]|uniref:serine hydrolase domain-containing protein n=1 Tax=Glycomyces amatae TaxID=2881355 RepID=UPI001E578B96|nr:serine hydrolase domain-containing protein [Glycomyces amatae]MCD0444167.1 beta-lactamase family protein [Glycomyces amatae]